jgi:hypothetical protein
MSTFLRGDRIRVRIKYEGETPPAAGTSPAKSGKGKKLRGEINSLKELIKNLVSTDIPKLIDDKINPLTERLPKAPEAEAIDPELKNISPEARVRVLRLEADLKKQRDELAKFSKQAEEAQKQKEDTDRRSYVKDVMGDHEWRDDRAKADTFNILISELKRTDDGQYIGSTEKGDLPFPDFVSDYVKERDYLLKGIDISGAGTKSGKPQRVPGVGIETIRTGMTDAQRQAVVNQIQSVVAAHNQL